MESATLTDHRLLAAQEQIIVASRSLLAIAAEALDALRLANDPPKLFGRPGQSAQRRARPAGGRDVGAGSCAAGWPTLAFGIGRVMPPARVKAALEG
jgi:hypothetical protein